MDNERRRRVSKFMDKLKGVQKLAKAQTVDVDTEMRMKERIVARQKEIDRTLEDLRAEAEYLRSHPA